MTTKKGDVSTMKMIVFGVVGFLIVASLFLSPWFREIIAEKLPRIIPGFNANQTPAGVPGILRYNINADDIQIYDGINWNEFPEDPSEKIKIGNVQISAMDAGEQIVNYYYDLEKRGLPPSTMGSNKISKQGSATYNYAGSYTLEGFHWLGLGNMYVSVPFTKLGEAGQKYLYLKITPTDEIETRLSEDRKWVGHLVGGKFWIDYYNLQRKSDRTHVDIVGWASTTKHLDNLKGQELPLNTKHPSFDEYLNNGNFDFYDYFVISGQTEIHVKGKNGQDYTLVAVKALGTNDLVVFELHLGETTGETLPIFFEVERDRGNWFKRNIAWQNPIWDSRITAIDSGDERINLVVNEAERKIKEELIGWRDSIFSQPMCFCYENDECALLHVEKLSAENKAYLVIDLNKPTGTCQQ